MAPTAELDGLWWQTADRCVSARKVHFLEMLSVTFIVEHMTLEISCVSHRLVTY